MWRPTLGEAYTFEPNMLRFNVPPPGKAGPKAKAKTDRSKDIVTGHITYINEAHRYFLVTADLGNMVIKESFKF